MTRPLSYFFPFFLLYACSSHFDKDKWNKADKQYEHKLQNEVLCKTTLRQGDKRENVIAILGRPDLERDSTIALYGVLHKEAPFDNLDKEFINNK